MIINTTKKDLFYDYLTWLNPVLRLKDIDLRVLASLLKLHYFHRNYPEDTLYELLFSEETLRAVAKSNNLSESQLNKAITSLEDKQLIQDLKLNPVLIQYPKDGNFKINIQFKVNENPEKSEKQPVSQNLQV